MGSINLNKPLNQGRDEVYVVGDPTWVSQLLSLLSNLDWRSLLKEGVSLNLTTAEGKSYFLTLLDSGTLQLRQTARTSARYETALVTYKIHPLKGADKLMRSVKLEVNITPNASKPEFLQQVEMLSPNGLLDLLQEFLNSGGAISET